MVLQVRVRHALGERVLELPARGADGPLVVGRAADADVQVPSVHVGLRQLLLFVRDGRWLVQDAPGGTGTSVNGTLLKGPQPLRGGDVLTLGTEADAPSLEIDPESIPAELPGPAAEPAADATAGGQNGQAPVAAALVRPAQPPATPVAAAAAGPQFAPPVLEVIVEGLVPEHGKGHGDEAPVEAAVVAPTPPPRRAEKPGRSTSSVVAVAVSMVAAVAIVTGAVVFVYLRKQQLAQQQNQPVMVLPPSPVPSTAPAPPKTGATVAAAPDIAPPPRPADPTDEVDETPDPRAATTGRSVAVVSPGSPTAAVGAATRRANPGDAPDPQFFGESLVDDASATEEEKEWKRVEGVYYHPNIAKALLTFDSYAEKYPDAHKEQIAKYREDMLDKLWWSRIDALVEKRKSLAAEIKKTQADVKAESEEAFRKTVLEPRLADQKARMAAVGERLRKEMMYNIDAPPPIGREPQMKALRAKRDRIVYEEWKKKTLKYIRDNHGIYPWANEQ